MEIYSSIDMRVRPGTSGPCNVTRDARRGWNCSPTTVATLSRLGCQQVPDNPQRFELATVRGKTDLRAQTGVCLRGKSREIRH